MDKLASSLHNLEYYVDKEMGINIKTFLVGPLIDQSKLEDIREEMTKYAEYEFVDWATQEELMQVATEIAEIAESM